MKPSIWIKIAFVCCVVLSGIVAAWWIWFDAQTPPPNPDAVELDLDDELADQLDALGYATRVRARNPKKKGLTVHKPDKAWPGYTLISSSTLDKSSFRFIDMQGKVVHAWFKTGNMGKVMPNGDLIALESLKSISRYTWDGDLIWQTNLKGHHDFAMGPDGTLYVLFQNDAEVTFQGTPLTITADGVAVVTPNGEITREIMLTPIFREHLSKKKLKRLSKFDVNDLPAKRRTFMKDLFHSNTLEYIPRDVPGMCRRGSFLISVRNIDRIACIDLNALKELWAWGGPGVLTWQHHPSLLDTNTILLFDNRTREEGSRVLELEPVSRRVVWEYTAPGFFSKTRGSTQKLDNGNVLIAESNAGRVFEVTPDGEVVWEYYTTDVVDGRRSAIYRVERYPTEYIKPLL